MKQMQIKLNQLVSPKDIKTKHLGSLYTLNNSFKRNTLYSFAPIRNEDLGYDCKLPRMSLRRKDLEKILDLILSKQEMTLPDRNFLRRIMLEIFDEELIHAGSRQFINYLRLFKQRSQDIVFPTERLFYFMLRGRAEVRSGGFSYQVSEGSTFGQMQLLSNENIESISYSEHSLLLTLTHHDFQTYFLSHFQGKYRSLQERINCIKDRYLKEIPSINLYYFLNCLKEETFNSGDKIIEKGKQVNRLYFVGNSWKAEEQTSLIDGCFGLKEIMKNKQLYFESAYSLDLDYKIAYVEKDLFVKYVKDFLINISNLIPKNSLKNTMRLQNPEDVFPTKMSLKRVRIHSKTKKIETQPFETITSEFKFFKNIQISANIFPKYNQLPDKSINLSLNKNKNGKHTSKSIQLRPAKKIFL